jgi:hypothetical protein
MLDSEQLVILIVAAAVVLLAGVIITMRVRNSRLRHERLKDRFGAEYDRVVTEKGGVAQAEAELREREQRVNKQSLRELTPADRERFNADWEAIQARFVDEPSAAVQSADQLIKEVMLARGYSRESIDQREVDLTVEHAAVVDDFRSARNLAQQNRDGRANTEELRQAFVHYRALFADILKPPTRNERNLQEAHA